MKRPDSPRNDAASALAQAPLIGYDASMTHATQIAQAASAATAATRPRIGVLGGMGPLATADFLAKLCHATPAVRDQDHFSVTIESAPQIPDRLAALNGTGEDPLAAMLTVAHRLQSAGCDLIAIPCNTAHCWYDQLAAQIEIPVLHIADAVAAELGTTRRVWLIGTIATINSALFPKRLGERFEWRYPDVESMANQVTPGIAAVKRGDLQTGQALLSAAVAQLAATQIEALVLACTEIPLVVSESAQTAGGLRVIDATAALARATVRAAQAMAKL